MNIFDDITQVTKEKNTVITIGTFDGFHVGHQQIVTQAVNSAAARGGRSYLITFEPHPRSVVSRDFELKLLTTLDEKLELLKYSGIENVLVINFTPEFSKLTYEDFLVNYIVEKTGISELVIGHDHRLGKNRDGDENKLIGLGHTFAFDVTPVQAVKINEDPVSSTKIRQAIAEGNIEKANRYLGRKYSFKGKVIQGAMRGRTLGFPTANVAPQNAQKLIPPRGVYIVEFIVNNSTHFGLMNIGMRPTFGDTVELVIEVYIFSFNKNIYNEEVTVRVLQKLRDEKKFSSREELVEQIETDKRIALDFIDNLNN